MTSSRAQAPSFTAGSSETPSAKIFAAVMTVPNSSFAIRQSEPSTEIPGNSPSRMGVREVGALLNESAQADAAGYRHLAGGITAIDNGEDVNVENFVAFHQHLEWREHASLNVISGVNDTGKTHLLSSKLRWIFLPQKMELGRKTASSTGPTKRRWRKTLSLGVGLCSCGTSTNSGGPQPALWFDDDLGHQQQGLGTVRVPRRCGHGPDDHRLRARLVQDNEDHKVFLVLDNLRAHHAKEVAAWVRAHEHETRCSTCHPTRPTATRMNTSTGTSRRSCAAPIAAGRRMDCWRRLPPLCSSWSTARSG